MINGETRNGGSDSSLSYKSIYELRNSFRKSGARQDTIFGDFNDTDSPQTIYFRILFHFNEGGLLDIDTSDKDKYNPSGSDFRYMPMDSKFSYTHNSAYNYLMMNNEFERADMLVTFVNLLKNINTMSPWYWTELSGLDSLLQRPELYSDSFNPVTDDKKFISIKCLPDAFDNRISTLLELYRSICFSQSQHKTILPANLRKFDMSIYLFDGLNRNMHNSAMRNQAKAEYFTSNNISAYDSDSNISIPSTKFENDLLASLKNNRSSKLIELRNCEINPDSSTSGYGTFSNAEGTSQEFTIGIGVDVAYEQRYNEFIQTVLGDFIRWDLQYNINSRTEIDSVDESRDETNSNANATKQKIKDELSANTKNYLNWYDSMKSNNNTSETSIGSSIGATPLQKLSEKYGMNNIVDKAAHKMADIVDKYDPLLNAERAIDNATSVLSQDLNQKVSNLIFGNIFYNDLNNGGLKEIANNVGNEVRNLYKSDQPENVGIKAYSSQLKTNLHSGWKKN